MQEFILKNKESADEDIKRILYDQIDTALSYLENESDNNFDESIHEVRKCMKRIRAVIRLIRDDIGKQNFRRENFFFRDINRNVSELRSINVNIETLAKLNSDQSTGYEALIDHFIELKEKIIYKLCLEDDRLGKVVKMLKKGKNRTGRILIKNKDFEILFLGFIRVFNQCLRSMILAKKEPTNGNLHEWRKKAKYLYYQFQVLEPVLPEELGIYTPKLDKLADYLGEDHDLSELEDSLRGNPYVPAESNKSASIYNIIDKTRYDKQKVLFSLAGEIFDERLKTSINNLFSG
jgi:CHAD domain-containing protein